MIRLPALVGLAGLATACSGDGGDGGDGGDVVSPNVPPVAAFASSCSGATCSFTDASTDADGRIVGYRWSFGDASATETARDVQHIFGAPGTYTVELGVTDDGGGIGSADSVIQIIVRANTPPVAGFDFSCVDLSCSFTDSSHDADGVITAYQWSFGDADSGATSRDASHSYAAPGEYTVGLTVTDDSGGTASVTHLIQAIAPPNSPPTAAFGVVCAHLTCTFSDSSSDADGRVVYWYWSFGDGVAENGSGPVHTYAADGSYNVQLTVMDDQGQTDSTGKNVTVPGALAGEPTLAFSDNAIGFCFSPAQVRNCVRLEEHVLFTSTGSPLAWKATSSDPWIVVQPASGTTDTDVRVFVDHSRLPVGCCAHGTSISGSLTVSAAGAGNSPQTIPVWLQFYSSPPPR